MKTIHLYGALKDKLGASLRLDVLNAAEAIRAIVTTRPEANEIIRDGQFVLVRRKLDTKSGRFRVADLRAAIEDTAFQLDEETMALGLGKADLHIIPVVGGAGGRGVGKVLLGAAMIAGAWVAAPAIAGGISGTGIVGGHIMSAQAFSLLGMSVSYGALATMGAMMALGGLSQMLAKAPEAAKSQDTNDSYIFSGPANVGSQSNPVPVIHGGPIRVGSVTVSSSITTQKSGGIAAGWGGLKGTLVDNLVNR